MSEIFTLEYAKHRYWKQWADQKHVAELEGNIWFEQFQTPKTWVFIALDNKSRVTSPVMGC